MEETKKKEASAEKEAQKTAAKEKTAEAKAEKAEKKKLRETEAALAEKEAELAAATEALTACEDKYMRMMAEYDNFRKRSAKEKEAVWADAYGDCIANLLPILDNLERASGSDNLEAVKKGLELTAKAFSEALDRMGVSEVETKTFDPNLHNAVMHVEDDSYGESEIVEVFQKGYAKGDRVIRYAMVKVAN